MKNTRSNNSTNSLDTISFSNVVLYKTCKVCGGRGKIRLATEETCPACKGTKKQVVIL